MGEKQRYPRDDGRAISTGSSRATAETPAKKPTRPMRQELSRTPGYSPAPYGLSSGSPRLQSQTSRTARDTYAVPLVTPHHRPNRASHSPVPATEPHPAILLARYYNIKPIRKQAAAVAARNLIFGSALMPLTDEAIVFQSEYGDDFFKRITKRVDKIYVEEPDLSKYVSDFEVGSRLNEFPDAVEMLAEAALQRLNTVLLTEYCAPADARIGEI